MLYLGLFPQKYIIPFRINDRMCVKLSFVTYIIFKVSLIKLLTFTKGFSYNCWSSAKQPRHAFPNKTHIAEYID